MVWLFALIVMIGVPLGLTELSACDSSSGETGCGEELAVVYPAPGAEIFESKVRVLFTRAVGRLNM
jgi:hypothetical protein